jgi:hypothetical protein
LVPDANGELMIEAEPLQGCGLAAECAAIKLVQCDSVLEPLTA